MQSSSESIITGVWTDCIIVKCNGTGHQYYDEWQSASSLEKPNMLYTL